MEIRQLRYFLAVAREANITRTAESLHISQPSLSKQLMELERKAGRPLLIRGKRKIALTEAGVLLRRRAEEIVALIDKTQGELASDEAIAGEVAVGGNPTATVLKAAAAVRAAHPRVRFEFYGSDAIDVLGRLDRGTLDFAVVLEPVDGLRHDWVPLPDSSRWGVLVPSDHPMAAQGVVLRRDLASLDLVLHRRDGLQRRISRWALTEFDKLSIASTYNVINGSPEKFVNCGFGCYLTTEDLLPAQLDKGVCFCPLEPPLEIHYALIWNRYASLSKAAQAFLEAVRQQDLARSGPQARGTR